MFGRKRVFQFGRTEKQFNKERFFTTYELSNTFCEVTDSLAHSSSMGDENQEELKLDVYETVTLRQDIL